MRPIPLREIPSRRSAPLDDAAMEQHVRSLAVSLNPDGHAALKMCARSAVRAPLENARALSPQRDALPASLEWLLENGRLTESFLQAQCLPNPTRLPAANGLPRIQHLMQFLVSHSDASISSERLQRCLSAFDEVRALTMDELWAVPAALAAALCREYIHAANTAVITGRDQCAALSWLEEGAPVSSSLLRRSAAFFECALRRMHEENMPSKYQEIVVWLQAHDRQAQRLITLAHEQQSINRLLLGNILSTLRMLGTLDWNECFRRLSPTERILLDDPSGTYPRMDEESCSQIRRRIACIARRSGMAEATAARCALEAAQVHSGIQREICWWLYTDEGTQALLSRMGVRVRIPRLIPDPLGHRLILCTALLSSAFFSAAYIYLGIAAALLALPVLWGASSALLNALWVRIYPPRTLLRLNPASLPDEYATLLVMPALLTSPGQACTLAHQLETLGCLETDENLSFLLLGDLCDHDSAHKPDDEEIIQTAQRCIDEANRRAGREKYYFLHRERVLQPCERRYMGRERKRGALNALNRLLLKGENEFVQSSAAALEGRFAFVITVDAGTSMLPGTAHRLIGTLAHPLNRLHRGADGRTGGYALLAPRMETAASSVVNRFVQLYGGRGGVDCYPTSVSNVYQDLCGQGIFGGKGIYDVEAFENRVGGRLPDNAVLSHDMIEGILARSAWLSDTALYEGHPRTVSSYLMRLNRWTRGDWQLLLLCGRPGICLSALDRYKIADNLRRSLEPLSQLLLLYTGFYRHSAPVVLLGLVPFWLPALLKKKRTKDDWMLFLTRLSLLPHEVRALTGGIVRALWRMIVSRRGLLEWVTADEADKKGGPLSPAAGWAASALLLPTLLAPSAWLMLDVLLSALWWTSTALVLDLEQPLAQPPAFTHDERRLLTDLARRTFAFFEQNTSSTGLPPDNVQLEPAKGAARRTSPTNIGLYMASCSAARELGLISAEEMTARLSRTLDSLERMEKHCGQLYNWYHTETLCPLHPRYVSSVDSGNLACCMLLCARALEREGSPQLARRMEALVRDMNFSMLYDQKRHLFHIGMDVESGRLSPSHYDLLASESRLLSFCALMLGQVPLRHWPHLGRSVLPAGGGAALCSWSGTMFEYLMPQLFLPLWPDTLLERTHSAAVNEQIAHAADNVHGLWGISESGYYAFDAALNYQYRAFGLPSLALRGDARSQVIAPYASMLAIASHPDEVLDNLHRMEKLGLSGEQGLFEAADYSPERLPEGADMRIVKSHMAHHQGMILCAVCNALTDHSLVRLFFDRPEAQALSLLLQEKPAPDAALPARAEKSSPPERHPAPPRMHRSAHPLSPMPDTHILSGLNTVAVLSADGRALVRRGDVLLSRMQCDPSMPAQGIFVHVCDRTHAQHLLLSGTKYTDKETRLRVRFDAGCALYHTQTPHLDSRLRAFVSPEDGAFLQHILLTNRTDAPLELDITGCFETALARQADYDAHPVFQNLFVESRRAANGVLCFCRRPRSPKEQTPLLIHALAGAEGDEITFETDLSALVGRNKLLCMPGSLNERLSGTTGHVLTPCSALRLHITLPAHGTRELCFCAGLTAQEETDAFIERHTSLQSGIRALELAQTQARQQLRYLNLSPSMYHTLDRAAALLLYPCIHAGNSAPPASDFHRSDLWRMGISGDLPVILGRIRKTDALEAMRELIRAHEFYHLNGLPCDLVIINEYGSDYEQPLRERLQEMISGSHLCGMNHRMGGVHLLEASALSGFERELLCTAAALHVDADAGAPGGQLRHQVEEAVPPPALNVDICPSDALSAAAPLALYNGLGGFSEEGYVIERPNTPAPWCNILCNKQLGTMISERGGSFTWYKNSRSGRITPFDNDPLQEGWGDVLLLKLPDGRTYAPALRPARCTHLPGASIFEGRCKEFSWRLVQFVDSELPLKCQHLSLHAAQEIYLTIQARIDFLAGVSRADVRFTSTGFSEGMQWARGGIGALAFACFGSECAASESGMLTLRRTLHPGAPCDVDLLLGAARTIDEAEELRRCWSEKGGSSTHLPAVLEDWHCRLSAITLRTPHSMINRTVNEWLPYQTMCARILGRAGFYQAGGAFGFRDQLQDMLCMLLIEPDAVRNHLIVCAAHQFEEGDVQHWWHPERTGVRTNIRDDMLFLPYVTAEYIETTQDSGILDVIVPFLKNIPIPPGQEDCYAEAEISAHSASLHEHCLRAIRKACARGEHGLLLMGAGDWNDGMNRVGHLGRGESVWLTEFMIVVLEKYAPLCDRQTQNEFYTLARSLREAVESNGWDGKWYRRAYADDGSILGSAQSIGGCRIDSLAQSWAVFAGLSRERVKCAMQEVDRHLIDRELGIIRLLAPPFGDEDTPSARTAPDPGYIKGYPPGIRENGGQYTHAACWVVIAFAKLGMADKAWETFLMLMPWTHSDTKEKALRYRVEPYVIAADIYSEPPHAGRGGWTWYTGAAGWMVRAAYVHLMGYKRRGRFASINALLPLGWDEVSMQIRTGSSTYTLTARRDCGSPLLDGHPLSPDGVPLADDGQDHYAVFPPRPV